MGLIHEPIELSDGYRAHARWWLPDSPLGAVLYLHGIESHGGWFEASASRLAGAGFAVLLPDRRGSGANRQDRGHARSAGRLLADVEEQLAIVQSRASVKRVHLAGVSWGGKLAAAYAARGSGQIASLTLIAPGLFPQVDLPAAQKLRVGLAAVFASQTTFAIPLEDPSLFTGNPERITFIGTDPLRLRSATAGLLLASWKLDRLARRLAWRRVDVPVHLFLAEHDRIIHNEPTRMFVRSLSDADRVITEYRRASHTLEFEAAPEPFLADLVRWLEHAEQACGSPQAGARPCCQKP
ncbi:MAG TPA: alpha/beta fold hydrolase [Phycisphaerae bacterium]|nr:alpha/beta fold hydrolase [Phycisphaerae bacterium]